MSLYRCKYHPLEAASWLSVTRDVGFCDRCVLPGAAAKEDFVTVSLLDEEPLEHLGKGHRLAPFVDCVGAFLIAPLKGFNLLAFFIGIAVCVMASQWILDLGEVGQFLGLLLVILAMSLIAGMVINQQRERALSTLSLSVLTQHASWSLGYSLLPINVWYGVLLFGAFWSGIHWVAFWAVVISMVAWPASCLMVAAENDVKAALSPREVMLWMRRMGWNYALVVSFIVLLFLLARVLVAVFWEELPREIGLPIALSLLFYGLLVASYSFGYLLNIHDYLKGNKRAESYGGSNFSKHHNSDIQCRMQFVEGRHAELLNSLVRNAREQPSNLLVHERLGRLLVINGNVIEALAHGQHYLVLLNELGDSARLSFQYRQYQMLDQNFIPQDPGVCLSLAEQQYKKGQYKDVCRLLVKLHERSPDFSKIADAYLLVADSLLVGFGGKQKAAQYLKYIKQHFPGFYRMREVDELLGQCV